MLAAAIIEQAKLTDNPGFGGKSLGICEKSARKIFTVEN
jgi:hypothetical protein